MDTPVTAMDPRERRFIWIPPERRPRSWWDKATTDAWEWVLETVDDTFGGASARRSQEQDLDQLLRPVRATLPRLEGLVFPEGHPRIGALYARHPVQDERYYPFAMFHRILFEQKFNEIIRILRHLA